MPMPSQRMKRSHMRTRSKRIKEQDIKYETRMQIIVSSDKSIPNTELSVARHVFKSNPLETDLIVGVFGVFLVSF